MNNDNNVPLFELWHDLWSRRWLILVIICVLEITAIMVAVLAEPVYRSSIVIMTADTQEQKGILGSLASGFGAFGGFLPQGFLGGGGDESLEAAAILLSRAFTESFIVDENLLPILFSDKWDPEQGDWRDPLDVPSMNRAFSLFDREIRKLDEDEWFGTLILTVEWHDRELAARWANLMVERLNERIRSRAVFEAESSLQYLNEELQKASILNLREAIYVLVQDQINKIMLANVRKEYAFKVIDPAVVADEGAFVWPNRVMLISLGLIVGLPIGIFIALLLGAMDRARRQFLERSEQSSTGL
jgi:hypothetical protein